MSLHSTTLSAAALCLVAVCSCDSGTQTPADTYIAPQVANASPAPIFEGLQHIALDFSGTDFTGVVAPPTIEATSTTSGNPPGPGDVEITDWMCNNVRCGVALRLGKWLPGHGQPVPPPIRGQQLRFMFQGAVNQISAIVLVLPLDKGGGNSTTSPPHLVGTYMFHELELGPGVRLGIDPDPSGLPGRILVTGDAIFHDGSSIDVSGLPGVADPAAGGAAGSGGFPGAAGGANAALPAGGSAGSAPGGGGGGGGFGEPGEPGAGVPEASVGGAGGTAGQGPELDCLRANTSSCGGGGGGSAGSGEGGGGGAGGVLVVSLGSMTMTGVAIRANGGTGAAGGTGSGGGGGAGGAIGLGAVSFAGDVALEAQGGSGGAAGTSGAAGGAGGDGRVRIDVAQGAVPTASAATIWNGPAVDLSALDVVTRDAEVTLTGRGEPGATIRVRNYSVTPARLSEATVAADGTFSALVPLDAGQNDLEVAQRAGTLEARSFTGTMYELVGRAVIGARIYIVRVPEVE